MDLFSHGFSETPKLTTFSEQLCETAAMPRTQAPAITRILQNGGGFDFDVALPNEPQDAKNLLRLLKHANRRGRLRFFTAGWNRHWDIDTQAYQDVYSEGRLDEDGAQSSGYRNLREALIEYIGGGDSNIVCSFEDRSDARAFKRELDRPVLSRDAAASLEAQRHAYDEECARIRASYSPDGLYEGWCVMVAPLLRSAGDVDAWMRRHIKFRYTVGLYRPHRPFNAAKNNQRYWRLSQDDWKSLIEGCVEDETLLTIHFEETRDFDAFNRHYGPGQFFPMFR